MFPDNFFKEDSSLTVEKGRIEAVAVIPFSTSIGTAIETELK